MSLLSALYPLSHTVGELVISGSVLGVAAAALWATVMVTALQRSRLAQWWGQLPLALAIGAGTALAALQLLPPGPPPGLAEFGYTLPAPRLHQLAAAFGVAAAAAAWPLLAMRQARRSAPARASAPACDARLTNR